jgi:hypothetical protein
VVGSWADNLAGMWVDCRRGCNSPDNLAHTLADSWVYSLARRKGCNSVHT